MKRLNLSFIFVLFFSCVSLQAAPNDKFSNNYCDNILLGRIYQFSTHLSRSGDEKKLSLMPEMGSLEAQYPGLSRELMQLYAKVAAGPYDVTTLNSAVDHLRIMQNRISRKQAPTFGMILDFLAELINIESRVMVHPNQAANPRNFAHERLIWLTSNIWQAVVATHFSAQLILFNQDLYTLYPKQINRLAHKIDGLDPNLRAWLEIDLMIVRPDNHVLWVEIKDSSAVHTASFSALERTRRQCARLRQVANALSNDKVTISTVLANRHGGLPGDIRRAYNRLACHRAIFMYAQD